MDRCKPMETPLVRNWNKEHATSSEEVDVTGYRQLVDSLTCILSTHDQTCTLHLAN